MRFRVTRYAPQFVFSSTNLGLFRFPDFCIALIPSLMTSADLTREQIGKLKVSVGACHAYLRRLMNRMDQCFSPTDKLYRLVSEALDKVHALSVELHYLSCAPGTAGR